MERYNPFATESRVSLNDDRDPLSINPLPRQVSSSSIQSITSTGSNKRRMDASRDEQHSGFASPSRREPTTTAGATSRYSTSFPDPFTDAAELSQIPPPPPLPPPLDLTSISSTAERIFVSRKLSSSSSGIATGAPANRSNSVTFLHKLEDSDTPRDSVSGMTSGPTAAPTTTSSSTGTPTRHPHIQRGATTGRAHPSPGGGLGSFLSRATSVTSSSVTERVSGAVGSVRNAVDSFSTNLSSTASLSSTGSPASAALSSPHHQQQQSAASYLASKLSSATNQFVGTNSSSSNGPLMPVISRQRVVLILDAPGAIDWPSQFTQYRRLVSGLGPTSTSSSLAFTSFFSSVTSSTPGASVDAGADLIEQADSLDISVLANQSSSTASVFVSGGSASLTTTNSTSAASRLSSSLSGATATAATMFTGGGGGGGTSGLGNSSPMSSQTSPGLPTGAKIVRPEYVVMRQRASKERAEHFRNVVKALHYCQMPMFEPYELWQVFQDRQLIFARLLRVQNQLGRENFPLIPQIFCQTHQDLTNYINTNGSTISLPCLVRTGHLGKGKLRIENLQMLKDFATIMATSEQSCTIEQSLDVKCDLIVQRLGTSLKLFRRTVDPRKSSVGAHTSNNSLEQQQQQQHQMQQQIQSDSSLKRQSLSMQQSHGTSSPVRLAAARQTSLSSGVLSSIISSTSSGLQQVASSASSVGASVGASVGGGRRTSNPTHNPNNAFEKMSEVNGRYREWVEAISREFDHKLDAFCIKIVVAANDREYIVGLRNCSMDFVGNQENQDEDKRSLVELIISKMNTVLPKHNPVSRETSAAGQYQMHAKGEDDTTKQSLQQQQQQHQLICNQSADKKNISFTDARFSSESLIGNGGVGGVASKGATSGGHLNSRSRSIQINQSGSGSSTVDSHNGPSNGASRSIKHQLARRSSDRADSFPQSGERDNENDAVDDTDVDVEGSLSMGTTGSAAGSSSSGLHQRQMSLGQSIFDQTSTAFSSFHKQSLSFLKRLDSRTGDLISSTPPLSAKSDVVFDRHFGNPSSSTGASGTAVLSKQLPLSGPAIGSASATSGRHAGFKSQSVDVTSTGSLDGIRSGIRPSRAPPPKPPPPAPPALMSRQSSLANCPASTSPLSSPRRYDSPTGREILGPITNITTTSGGSCTTINSTTFSPASASTQKQTRVVRQNSALSAFEPFDPELKVERSLPSGSDLDSTEPQHHQRQQVDLLSGRSSGGSRESTTIAPVRPSSDRTGAIVASAYGDTVSTTSANSNSTDETTTAEDTMNNLKRTFASIFGDKCE